MKPINVNILNKFKKKNENIFKKLTQLNKKKKKRV